ncbi:hypothetical protein A6B39_08320 [Mannheimia granulomatis]|uniref:RsiV family protein n=1 Tax=Mannheimia granulomatis TaxID=85402 RepID=UPI00159DF16C|nr:RsiV family protein [Mannheimia granulomatis]QLB15453.1 hypothetical protein A6B39_08320 [Mannheimia granulomatis]
MKKSLLALMIAAVLMTTACEDKETLQKLQQAEKAAVQLETDLKSAKAENETLKAELVKAQQNAPLQVEIVKIFNKSEVIKHKVDPKEEYAIEESKVTSFVTIPKTNLAWLNNILVKFAYDHNEEQDRKLQHPTEQDLIKSREKIYQDMVESAKEEPVFGYEESIYSDFVGQRNNIATFSMQPYSYGGGAHGLHHTSYINVDLNKKSVISLNDLVSEKNQAKLKEALWESYAVLRVDENGKYNGFADKKEFRISSEFYFGTNGIVFVYPPYELGPYAEGDVEVELPWYQANELLSPDYQRGEKDGFFKQEE